MKPEWLTAIGTISVVIAALILAIFHEHLRTIFWKPDLDIEFENTSPDAQKIPFCKNSEFLAFGYYFRIRVINNGRAVAKNVEVFLEEIKKRGSDGRFEKWTEFLPMNLFWSHFKKLYCPGIAPGLYKHCDIGYIIDPQKRQIILGEDHPILKNLVDQSVMNLSLVVKPTTGTYIIKPGFYQLVLIIAAENAKSVRRKTLELKLTGKWSENETEMFQKGVSLRII